MARKRKPEAPENHERWLISYADFITLLFAFFVVMFASSQTDKARARQISEAFEQAVSGKTQGVPPAVAKILGGTVDDKGQGNAQMKGPGGAKRERKETPPEEVIELIPSLKRLSRDLEAELKSGSVELKLEPRGLVVSLRQSAFFPSGADSIARNTYPTLEKVAAVLRSLPNPVQLEGHTDSVPIHNARFQSNWELSSARAIALLNLFCGPMGLDSSRFAVVGRADTAPVDSNDTAEGRARNRRVDVVIVNILGTRPTSGGAKGSATPRNPAAPKKSSNHA